MKPGTPVIVTLDKAQGATVCGFYSREGKNDWHLVSATRGGSSGWWVRREQIAPARKGKANVER